MNNYKIIFSGPVGAGKTTAVGALSDTPPVRTDTKATDQTRLRKAETTVALDYGLIRLANGSAIHLYGTPGQERFDFMWDILTEGGIGLVLLLDNAGPDPFADLDFFLAAFRGFIGATAVVIGVTRTDVRPVPTLDDYHRELQRHGLDGVPVFEVDAREREDVSLLVEALLCSLDPVAATATPP